MPYRLLPRCRDVDLPDPNPGGDAEVVERSEHLLLLSAKEEPALRALAQQYEAFLETPAEMALGDICFSANAGRTRFPHRLAVVADSSAQVREKLGAFGREENEIDGLQSGGIADRSRPRSAFLFTGQGAQSIGMGRQLYETHPGFRRTLDECDEILRPHLEKPLLEVIFEPSDGQNLLDATAYTQPALFALEYGLARLWQSWGVEPDALMGHSVGEYAAACIAGVFSLEDGLQLIAARGRLMQDQPAGGAMAAVRAPEERVRAAVELHAEVVSMAAVNGPGSSVISGEHRAVEAIVESLRGEGREATFLAVSHAFHSPLMEPVLEPFSRVAETVTYEDPQIDLISNVTGGLATNVATSQYWVDHIRQPVRFASGMEALHELGCGLFVEIGPKPVLLGMGRQCLVSTEEKVWLASLRQRTSDWQQLFQSLGTLYLHGFPIDWCGVDRGYARRRVSLPSYPFQRQRHWIETGEETVGRREIGRLPMTSRKTAFAFSGIGAQWKGMGVELFNSEAVFRRTIKECDCIIGQHADWSLVEELTKGEAESRIEESLIAHPCNFSIQVALVALLRSWGVEPGAVVGHSSGEVAAAHTAGVFDLNDAIHIIWHHCLLMQKVVGKGCMAHISLPWDEVRDLAGDHLDRVTIAAINSPKSTVLSGDVYILEELVAMFESRGSFCRMLEIDIPFHSPKVEPHREEFQRAISDIDIHSSKIPIYSSYRGEMAAAGDFTPSYWSEHIRQQVLFGSAVGAMIQDGYDAFIEIGPHPVLSVSIREVFEEQNRTDSLVVNTLRRGEEEKGELLRGLADLDVAGCLVDWNRLKVADQGRGRAFIDALGARSLQGDIPQPNALHPLWEKRWQSPLHEETVYETRFSAVSPSFLADHVIFENIVVPGASHISMLLGVAELSFGEGSCTLENILFSQALVIPPETARVVQVVAKPGDDAIKLISFAESEEPGSSWVEHVSGRLIDGAPAPEPVLLPAARERCSQQIPGAALYRVMEQLQFRLGADFQWVESIWQGDGEMLCRMKLPRQFTGTEGYQLYPGLIDSCFQPALLAVAGEEQRTFVPFMVEKFLYYRPSTEAAELWCHIAFRESATQDAERLVMDTRLCDETGQVIAEAVGLELRQASRKALRRSLEKDFGDLCYEVTWKPLERNGRRMDDGPGSWLILADGEGLGEELAARLRGEGENCVIVERGSAFAQTGGDHYRVDPGAPGDFARLLRDCFSDSATSESGELPCRGIVHLWSLDTAFDQIIRADDLQEAQLIGCGSALHLVQALAQSGWERIPRLCLVTRGAQLVQTDFHPVQAQQTALWGLGQVISLEYPDLHCLRVDLDPSTGSDAVANLFEAIRGVAKEDRIAYRQDVPYSARLARTDYPVNGQSAPIRKDGSYLITGGLGALGLKVADWLAERGAGHLVLVGRRAPGEAARSEIDRLLQAGIRVTIAQADISEPGDVARVLATVEATEYPLRGVVHAAGVLDDGLLQGQDWDRFSKVMAPKVAGAWNLHDGTRELELDFFVCFSSITALLGAGGQGNYAAANAFMDGLAQHRRSSGLPGLSINWGPWGEVGMIAALDQRDWERWVGQGFGSIEPAQGVAILDRLLAREDSSQAAVLPIDWSLYLQQFRNGASTSFFEAIEPIDKEPKSTLPRGKFLEQLQSTPSAKQREVLVAYVRAQIGKVARLQAVEQIQPRQRLFDLGLDSLMAVELKDSLQSDLGRNLSATLVFDYPTIEALGDHLYGDILGLAQEAQEEPEVYVGEEDLTDLEDLSREEIGALLDEKLSELDL